MEASSWGRRAVRINTTSRRYPTRWCRGVPHSLASNDHSDERHAGQSCFARRLLRRAKGHYAAVVSRYTYGDSPRAAERLALVASTFEPTSRAFIAKAAPRQPRLAVDLGCGPGHTTSLLAEVTGASKTVGLDSSASYVSLATESAPQGVTFGVHDATVVPFPVRSIDVIYARLLLAHLREPTVHVWDWIGELRQGGVALLDDLEAIETDNSTFRSYLDDIALEVIRREGGTLFVGPLLHSMLDPPGTERIHDAIASFAPPPTMTARIFSMNFQVLMERGEVNPRPDLADGLMAIAHGRTAEPVVWTMRQVAIRSVAKE
jgi:trans-aconitate 2-methyltransferase